MKYLRSVLGVSCMIGAGACTTLGPTPATTGVGALPASRPDVSVTGSVLPGYFLSSATAKDPEGTSIAGVALLVEPDSLLEVPGVILGARMYGSDSDGSFEPMIGYRRQVGSAAQPIGIGIVASFTHAADSSKGASYEASRGSAEMIGEIRVAQLGRWIELSINAALGATALDATGSYCADADGFGRDCGDDEDATTDAEASGIFVAGTGGLALDIGRASKSAFHGVRLGFSASAGTMPTVVSGDQGGARTYHAFGLSLGTSFGAAK